MMYDTAKFTLKAIALAAWALGVNAAEVDFNRDIRPILSDKCYACHGPAEEKVKGGFRASDRENAIKTGAIVPGDPSKSILIERVLTADADELMPPPEAKKPLSAREKGLLRQWVEQGAEYQTHWAFVAPQKAAFPEQSAKVHPIDFFVDRALAAQKLKRTRETDRAILIRRATFDLTGLPPTPNEVDAFVKDKRPNAYSKLIDRLLASERFGERMALYWMDAARYGDSSVMHADGPRDMWPWRDWVIRAYNDNMPYDQFTTEQIAGDLIPNATVQQKVASGFNRNHATSDEGGAIPEELRVEYVVDRVATTSTVWMGLTMECAQCHDHKYDPFTRSDYYSFYAYFNNTTDPGMQTRRGNQKPIVEVPTPDQIPLIAQYRADKTATERALAEHKKKQKPIIIKWIESLDAKDPNAIPEPDGLAHHFPLGDAAGGAATNAVDGSVAKLTGKLDHVPVKNEIHGLKFDGKTWFEAPDLNPGVSHSGPFTFAAWIKTDGKSTSAIFSKMDIKKDYRGFDFWLQGETVGTHIVNKWGGNNALKVVSISKLPKNKWSHVVLTYNGNKKADGIKIYIDGKLSKNKIEKNNLKHEITTDQPFRIGSRESKAGIKAELADLRIYSRALSTTQLARLGDNRLGKALAKDAKKRNGEEKKLLEDYYYETQDKRYPTLAKAAEIAKKQEANLSAKIITSMIMEDNRSKPRMTYMLDRGQYDKPLTNSVIKPGVPEALGALPESAPDNRLGLAQWLTKSDHPLTARVAVNRLWALYFGDGLVTSQTDFGNQGSAPSHPELLDWLAVDFVEHGWNVKRLVKQILMSQSYRQDSRASDRILRLDPNNRLIARGPRFRLQGEFIRDMALSVSGLLNGPIGGVGVKPYQPPNIWNEVSLNGGLRYPQDKGQKLYRRSMYTYWKRSAPMPNMLIFDAPTREKCVVKRERTNTPLQALVTLNDPQFVEAARALAERLITEGGDRTADRINYAYRLATSRSANSREISILTTTLKEQLATFKDKPEQAKEFLNVGDSKRNEDIDATEHAAWTVISQLILNLDESLTRG